MRKPRLFIASSSEGLPYAEAIFSQLERTTEPSLWTHDLFKPSETFVESLERIVTSTDYAVAVLSPDDVRVMRGTTTTVPRDNVIFEMGLLVGKLGRSKVFLVTPQGRDTGLPSDISGVSLLGYAQRQDGNVVASVATACRRISDSLTTRSRSRSPFSTVAFWNNVQERHRAGLDLRSLVEDAQESVFVSGISLRYLVHLCSNQLRQALASGATVDVLLPSDESVDNGHYDRHKSYVREEFPLAVARWREFARSLGDEDRSRLSITQTPLLLTHSIGVYDGAMYVNSFCAGLDSQELPSFRIDADFGAYRAYLTDIDTHLRAGRRTAGDRTGNIVHTLLEQTDRSA
ncbi:TIR domain-containing protein [Streptomyces sp. NPDC085524]|uniref:TIR domain-containing protein n=1 Tax=Streptomyces sp. NPDC085524 TaxID=3365728 RepID=UPI0037CDD64B